MDNSIKKYVIRGLLLLGSLSLEASASGPGIRVRSSAPGPVIRGRSRAVPSLSAATSSSWERAPLLQVNNLFQEASSSSASSSSSSTSMARPLVSDKQNSQYGNNTLNVDNSYVKDEEALFRADIGQALQISGISAGMKSGKAPQIKWRWLARLPNDCWPIIFSYLYDTECAPPMLRFQLVKSERISQEQFDQEAQLQLQRTVQYRRPNFYRNNETSTPKPIFNADGSLKLNIGEPGFSDSCPVELYRNKKLIFKKSIDASERINVSLSHDGKMVIVTAEEFSRYYGTGGNSLHFPSRPARADEYSNCFDIYEVGTGLNVSSFSSGLSWNPQDGKARQILVNKNGVFMRLPSGDACRITSPYEDQFKRMPLSQKILLGVAHQNYASSGLFSSSAKKASLVDISEKNEVKLEVLHKALRASGPDAEEQVVKTYNLEVNPKVGMCKYAGPKKNPDDKCVIL